jgi:hypothetical protein
LKYEGFYLMADKRRADAARSNAGYVPIQAARIIAQYPTGKRGLVPCPEEVEANPIEPSTVGTFEIPNGEGPTPGK